MTSWWDQLNRNHKSKLKKSDEQLFDCWQYNVNFINKLLVLNIFEYTWASALLTEYAYLFSIVHVWTNNKAVTVLLFPIAERSVLIVSSVVFSYSPILNLREVKDDIHKHMKTAPFYAKNCGKCTMLLIKQEWINMTHRDYSC